MILFYILYNIWDLIDTQFSTYALSDSSIVTANKKRLLNTKALKLSHRLP